MAARKRVERRQGTKGQAAAQRGTRPDPLPMELTQYMWGSLEGDLDWERFDYRFWPPDYFGYAEQTEWQPVKAVPRGEPGYIGVAAGTTVKPGEHVRGLRDQYLFFRPKARGKLVENYRRALVNRLFTDMGHESRARELHENMLDGREALPHARGLSTTGVQSESQTTFGEGEPYAEYQEQP